MRAFLIAIMASLVACSTIPADDPAISPPITSTEGAVEVSLTEKEAEALIQRVTSLKLQQFSGDEELLQYLNALEIAPSKRKSPVYMMDGVGAGEIVVTGARVSESSSDIPSITNNQVQGVDEGDIVKRIGNYLVTLQDGRVFTVAIRDRNRPTLEARDRIDAYASSDQYTWYDEMLVTGNRIVVTGYSYDTDATEIVILQLEKNGNLTFERRFFLSSDDYYDPENYAARMIGSKLVLHTPIWLSDLSQEDHVVTFPVVVPDRGGEDRFDMIDGRPLFKTSDIYRPVKELDRPMLHAVSICDLDLLGTEDFDGCDSTAFIGEVSHKVFVAGKDMYVWSWGGSDNVCDDTQPSLEKASKGTIHRISLKDQSITVSPAQGRPVNQFGMTEREGMFHGLARMTDRCWGSYLRAFSLLTLSEERFSDTYTDSLEEDYLALPTIRSAEDIENRFTDQYLLYSGSEDRYIDELFDDEYPIKAGSPLIVIDLNNTKSPLIIGLPHSTLRLDRAGPEDAIVTGYRGSEGLYISYIDLSDGPELTSTILMEDRFESENRSHAFNTRFTDDGGIIGLPTVPTPYEGGRRVSRSEASDLTFFAVDTEGQLGVAGTLLASGDEPHDEYDCEVSCVDWYGNSRPIFTDGRVFALSVSEVIEAKFDGKEITELERIDLTDPSTYGLDDDQ